MGILNVTPDSFSDGGRYLDTAAAVAHGLELVEQGADLLDVGGESSRPGAEPVSAVEEARRVIPVIEQLKDRVEVPVAIDTTKPEVARAALQAGASMVNDVAANRTDPEMWRVVAEEQAAYVCMHCQGTPQTMQRDPVYRDVVVEVGEFFRERLARLVDCGVGVEQIIFDVGIGFGKLPRHNLQLLAGLSTFARLERPLLIGASRKSFLGGLAGVNVADRLPGSLACACLAVEQGAAIVRVHDVAETVQAVRTIESILAHKQ